MIYCEEGEASSFCFIIFLAKVHPLFFSSLGPATRSLMAYIYRSFLKDLVCSPRPYAPPVTRLSKEQTISSSVPRLISRLAIGSHHFEYSFPRSILRIACPWRYIWARTSTTSIVLDPSRPQRSRFGSSYLFCTSHQLWAVGCTRGCTDSWTFSSGSCSEVLGGYCNAW